MKLNERTDTVAALYRYAVQAADCNSGLQWIARRHIAGVYGRKLRFKDGFLYVFVSEFAWDVDVEVTDTDSDPHMLLLGERALRALCSNMQG